MHPEFKGFNGRISQALLLVDGDISSGPVEILRHAAEYPEILHNFIGERAKRARHFPGVYKLENRRYVYILVEKTFKIVKN